MTTPLMTFKFEDKLPFQLDAIAGVVDVFEGETSQPSAFTLFTPPASQEDLVQRTKGVGNASRLLSHEILANLNKVQVRNGLEKSKTIDAGDLNLTVEMETGTGKTYVYLRTMFELHQKYGYSKFMIVVPSIAIKEGVLKSLRMMRSHLSALYGAPAFHHFEYSSKDLSKVRDFATSSSLQVMVATIQSLHKTDKRIFHISQENLGGDKPVDLIRNMRPVVIVDEPQSVDGGVDGRGRQALQALNPLVTLRYSATHAPESLHHMVYSLDAIDAYNQGLVKRISVASVTAQNAYDRPYVKVVSVKRKGKGPPTHAMLELDCATSSGGVQRRIEPVRCNDGLGEVTGREAIYGNMRVTELYKSGRDERVEIALEGGSEWLKAGDAINAVAADAFHRLMVSATVSAHLERQKALRSRGIKVLSLFFVDRVDQYRTYDKDGNAQPGPIAKIFEDEYKRQVAKPEYRDFFTDEPPAVDAVHDGYFSVDKKMGRFTDTQERNAAGRSAAQEAYSLIMRDKEKLLSFDTPLQFIFSHSALKEGWDNPNVFQICALRDMRSERQRRQSLGRGLRLCVNQNGERVRDRGKRGKGGGINELTVIAMEDFETFAKGLQDEMQDSMRHRFGTISPDLFGRLTVANEHGALAPLGYEKSAELHRWLVEEKYVTKTNRPTKKLKEALANESLELPGLSPEVAAAALDKLLKVVGGLPVFDARKRKSMSLNKRVLNSPEFIALWERIRQRTVYNVSFDSQAFIADCVKDMTAESFWPDAPTLQVHKTRLKLDQGGVKGGNSRLVSAPQALYSPGETPPLPDILTALQDRTGLTRKTIARILVDSKRLRMFPRGPQAFIEAVAKVMNRRRRERVLQDITYEPRNDLDAYEVRLFENKELLQFIEDNAIASTKSVYDHVPLDSQGVERKFAEALEESELVKLYVKLPSWFRIPTPLGTYNPDWAIVVSTDMGDQLYFVIETKGSMDAFDLRGTEKGKIKCGQAHFRALQTPEPRAVYHKAHTVEDFWKLLARTPKDASEAAT